MIAINSKSTCSPIAPSPTSSMATSIRNKIIFIPWAAWRTLTISQLIEDSAIDILVDLNGYSKMGRLSFFALRPAPVIVGWFNMFATTGMAAFDYLIGDSNVLPAEEERFYCEKILRVPGSYLTFAVDYPVPPVAEVASGPFTFGCLAPLYKITPEVVAVFSRVFAAVPESQLILRNSALSSTETQKFVFAQFPHGESPPNDFLEGPADHYQFLRTYERIDLALDTFPYNGGTTTTEAIWQGVPVIAFSGDRWVARTSAPRSCVPQTSPNLSPQATDWLHFPRHRSLA